MAMSLNVKAFHVGLLAIVGLAVGPLAPLAATATVLASFQSDFPAGTAVISTDRNTMAYVLSERSLVTGTSAIWVKANGSSRKVLEGKLDPKEAAKQITVGETYGSTSYEVLALSPDGRYLFYAETLISTTITSIGLGINTSSRLGNNPRFLRLMDLLSGRVTTPVIPTPGQEKFGNGNFSFFSSSSGFVAMELITPTSSQISVSYAVYQFAISNSGAKFTSVVKTLPKTKSSSFWVSRGYVPEGSAISANGRFVLLDIGLGNGNFELIDRSTRKSRKLSAGFARGVIQGISDDGIWMLRKGGGWFAVVNLRTSETKSGFARGVEFATSNSLLLWKSDAPFSPLNPGYGPWDNTFEKTLVTEISTSLSGYQPQSPDWSGLVIPSLTLSVPISCTWNPTTEVAIVQFALNTQGGNFYGKLISGAASTRAGRVNGQERLTLTLTSAVSVPGGNLTNTKGYSADYRLILYPFNIEAAGTSNWDLRQGTIMSETKDLSSYCRR